LRFNGATSFQTWKSRTNVPTFRAFFQLQWGHVFSDVEISLEAIRAGFKKAWLQWGHVFSDVEI